MDAQRLGKAADDIVDEAKARLFPDRSGLRVSVCLVGVFLVGYFVGVADVRTLKSPEKERSQPSVFLERASRTVSGSSLGGSKDLL
jgi:hypothetical protein